MSGAQGIKSPNKLQLNWTNFNWSLFGAGGRGAGASIGVNGLYEKAGP